MTTTLRIGDRVVIRDYARALNTCRNRDTGNYHGAGGVRLENPSSLFSHSATVAMVGDSGRRACIEWGVNDENVSVAIWSDTDNLELQPPDGFDALEGVVQCRACGTTYRDPRRAARHTCRVFTLR